MLFEDNLLLKIPTFVLMSPTEMWLPCWWHMGRQLTAEQTGMMAAGCAAAETGRKKTPNLCFQDQDMMADFTKP